MMQLDTMEGSFKVVEAGTATLYGVVYNPISQPPFPLDGATVEIPGVASDVTGSDGQYVLDNIPAGQHTVTARRHHFLDKEISVTLAEGESRGLDIPMYPYNPQFLLLRMDYVLLTGFRPTRVQGKLAITSKDAVKDGKGGMELEVYIQTLRPMHMAVEAVHWHYGYPEIEYGVGGIVFDYNIREGAVHAEHQGVSQGREYSYDIEITPGELIKIVFTDGAGNVILATDYACDAQYIHTVRVPIEYYWHPEEGTYRLRAYHMIERLYDPAIGWRNALDCLSQPLVQDKWDLSGFLHLKHAQFGNYFYIEGEVVDPGMVL